MKVTATPEEVEITGVVPVDITSTQSLATGEPLLTIGQTSGCLIRIDYDQTSGKESVSILPQ